MRAYQDMVFSTAARIAGNDTQAEDIAQEVFIRAYEHFSDLRSSVTAGGWLKTVTTNLTLNYLSRYRKRWRLFSELRSTAEDSDSEGPELDWEVPDTILADLSAEQRAAIVDAALAAAAGPSAAAARAVSLRGPVLPGDCRQTQCFADQDQDRHSPCASGPFAPAARERRRARYTG